MADERQLIRLCVQTFHPLDPGNYPGRPRCTACPEGTACVTALFERVPDTTVTDAERHNLLPPERRPPEPWNEATRDA